MAHVHRSVQGGLSSAWASHVVDWGGGCEGESLLDVVRLLFFLFLIAVSYGSVVLLYASVEMRIDEEEVFVVNWLWW